jgi:transposase-like protein
VTSIAAKIGCTPQTLHDWVKKAEVDRGQRAGRGRATLLRHAGTSAHGGIT